MLVHSQEHIEMRDSKKLQKENNIIEAAERVFTAVGYTNAKMDDIAKEASITKVTLYAYFQSKENLYMAMTYKSLQLLIENMYATVSAHKQKSGLDGTVAIFKTFMDFCESSYLYAETLLDYFAVVRSTNHGLDNSKITSTMEESIYYMKMQDIQNLPFKITAKEISRGQEDGSIKSDIDPMLHTLHGWTQAIGYIKVLAASGNNVNPLFNVELSALKNLALRITTALLRDGDKF